MNTQIKTEALRIAKEQVKACLRSRGYKISSFAAKAITDMAKKVLAEQPSIAKKAAKIVAMRHFI